MGGMLFCGRRAQSLVVHDLVNKQPVKSSQRMRLVEKSIKSSYASKLADLEAQLAAYEVDALKVPLAHSPVASPIATAVATAKRYKTDLGSTMPKGGLW